MGFPVPVRRHYYTESVFYFWYKHQACNWFHDSGLIHTWCYTQNISMGYCKKDVTPSLTHWIYVFLALPHRYRAAYYWYATYSQAAKSNNPQETFPNSTDTLTILYDWKSQYTFSWLLPHLVLNAEYSVTTQSIPWLFMMTSSNGNIFRVTGPLWGESTGHRWIPLTKASDAEMISCISPEQTVMQTIETPVIWNAIALIITSLQCDAQAPVVASSSATGDLPINVAFKFYMLQISVRRNSLAPGRWIVFKGFNLRCFHIIAPHYWPFARGIHPRAVGIFW